ncbi:glycosyltransferase [uncultured Polaribacter sp.]|uniref:glycosyltransferase n=1 Tax=uncultured Polaribacter sp. TaxID=174711 RepID=UPI00259BD561|nr:glycosyltransferase [uncultured Polaribacter sp.]
MKRIIVSVSNDLSTDQRVEKVCNTLHQNNFEILLIGRILKNSLPLNRNYKTKRMSLMFNSGFLFYAEYNLRLFFLILFSKKDILLANDIDTLLPNYIVSKIQRKKIVFDSHELFSEIPELETRPTVKKVWQTLEDRILPKLKNTYTVCDSIAAYFNKKYTTNFKVIKNAPISKKDSATRSSFSFPHKGKKIILYQGSVNIGRGLELMIDTMIFLDNHLFVIIGSGDIYENLKVYVRDKKLENKVYFLGKLPPNQLKELTPLADIGISLEEDIGLSYRYALPNKIFDYIQAKVPILVSDLPEMKEIVNNYNVGEIVLKRNSESLANQIKIMIGKDYNLALEKAKKELIWENESIKLLTIFNNLK